MQPQTQTRRYTVEEYRRLIEAGAWAGVRTELIDGEVIEMPPPGPENSSAMLAVEDVLRAVFTTGYHVRGQMAFDCSLTSQPVPDVFVVPGTRQQYRKAHPTTAVLVVEVSGSSLSSDRNRKASLYAAAKVEDYWIVNYEAETLEVRRKAVPDEAAAFGYVYSELTVLSVADTITPLATPHAVIAVADLMP